MFKQHEKTYVTFKENNVDKNLLTDVLEKLYEKLTVVVLRQNHMGMKKDIW